MSEEQAEQFEECTTDVVSHVTRRETLLHVDNICKSYPMNDGGKIEVLKDFSLDIKDIVGKPQRVALLGPSGCGKTTALRIMAGLESPDSGSVFYTNGRRETGHNLCQVESGQVGVVFQKYPLFDDRNVLDNLVDPAVRKGTPRKEAEIMAVTYLDQFNLSKQASSYPVQLSGGQRQRVAILQQLMIPKRHFIILDEPFSGLDSENINAVIHLLDTISLLHTLNTFVIITHDVTSALILCDHIYLLGRDRDATGKIVSGARVKKEYDLISEGLAYHPNIESIPRFTEIRHAIKYDIMPTL